MGKIRWPKKGFTPLKIPDANYSNSRFLTGFTLIEIMVAAFILALVITGLASVFLAGKRHILHTRSKIQAAELGRLFLAPLQMDVRQDQWSSNCLGSGTGCRSTPTDDVLLGPITYKPTTAVTDITGTGLKKVKVTINWTEPSS